MSGVLSRLTKLGMAKEVTNGTYLVPTVSVPWNAAKYVDITDPLRDESVRANDAVLQALQPGAKNTTWELDINSYADFIGHLFVGMGLFDTISGGVSTTLSSATTAGATSISVAVTIPQGSIVTVGTGAAVEYVTTGTPSGSGPFVIPVAGGTGAGLISAHGSGDPVVGQTTHTFKQNRTFSTVWPSYSFTTNDGVDILGWAGCVMSELAVKIDPKGLITLSPKYAGMPSGTQADFMYGASAVQPAPGWAWTVTNAGAASTRGLTMDITFKRAQELIHGSTGQQGPREVFAGALEIDGAYKAIFESDADINLFRNYTQTPTTHTMSQPVSFGGASLAVTMSQSGYTTGDVVNSGPYLQLDQNVSGIANATDGGVTSVVVKNFVSSAF